MAVSASTVAVQAVKKIGVTLVTEPEKLLKFFFFSVVVPIILLLLLLLTPMTLILNLPTLLIGNDGNEVLTEMQAEKIGIYQSAPLDIQKEIQKWIDSEKARHADCDDFQINNSFSVTWQQLMAIDTARFQQDFTNVGKAEVIETARLFVSKQSHTETYQVTEKYQTTETYYKTVIKNGKPVREERERTVTKTRTVTKKRLVIDVKSKPYESILTELSLNKDERDMAIQVLSVITGVDVDGNVGSSDDVNLSDLQEYPAGSANLPYYNQGDRRWGGSSYGGSNILKTGCGPTSLSMVISGLKRRPDINPKFMADWSVAHGHRTANQGTSWSLMTDGGKSFGLTVQTISRRDPQRIIKELSQGHPIIVSMGRGHFTRGGHFIVLRGINAEGKILVYDPASYKRTQQAWDIGIIVGESSTLGGASGSPFWVYK